MFCDLAETKSFTKTAQINEVTQSAVSQTMTTMERHFKSLLVERSKKNFRLTAEGETVYDYAKRMLQTFESLQSKLQEIKEIVSGSIRVATIYSIGLHVLPPYIKRFLKAFPTVSVHVEYRRPEAVYDDVLSNVVDLGLVAYASREPKLETVSLRKDPLVLICHPQHPFAKLETIKLKALNSRKFVSFDRDSPTRKALDKLFREHRVVVEHVMEFDNVETVKRAVEIDSGVAIVPQETIRQEVAKHTLASVRIEGNPFRRLSIIYKKNKVLSPAIKQFVALLREGA